ncbi:PLP-dependent aminotransferase family protein [Streptomyces sp. NPDC001941]|uniref:aminotransferase-like domain-containing protein n=1 Tax=Streptomyces sp. NPDC001941 TaxID=3154659 RepID=UPI00331F4080
MTSATDRPDLAAGLRLDGLHGSLSSPTTKSMNFLNEVAQHYPDAVSFAAGRPYEEFLDLESVHRQIDRFAAHLRERCGGDERRVRGTLLQYGRTKGIIHELIARNLELDEGVHVDPEAVVVTVGCQEALYLTLRALRRDERDVLLAVMPTYVGAAGAAHLVDMPVLPVAPSADGVDVDDLVAVARAARERGLRPRACYLVPDFGNPSGLSFGLETRERLIEAARDNGLLLLEDNPYGLFGPEPSEGNPPLPTLKSLDRSGTVVYLGSFAKTGNPGARVGYVVADQRVTGPDGRTELLADRLAELKSMLTVNTSPLAQAVIGGKLLENGGSLRTANSRESAVYRRNLRLVLEGLERRFPAGRRPYVTWNRPSGGFFLVCALPFAAGDDLLERCAREHRVLWTPMHHFYAGGGARRDIRLSVSHLEPDEIETGLDRLARFVSAHDA